MATSFTDWLVAGKGIATVEIISQTFVGGTATDSHTYDITLNTAEVNLNVIPRNNPVKPLCTLAIHYETISYDSVITISELLRPGSTLASPMNALSYLAYYAASTVKIIFVRGNDTWTGYFLVGDYTEGYNAEGVAVGSCTFYQQSTNSKQPSLTYSGV